MPVDMVLWCFESRKLLDYKLGKTVVCKVSHFVNQQNADYINATFQEVCRFVIWKSIWQIAIAFKSNSSNLEKPGRRKKYDH